MGYAPVFKTDADPGKSIENYMANVRFPGYGETGRLMGMFIQHKMIEGAGEAACEAPFYSRKLWDDRGSWFSAPSIRSLADIALAVAVTCVTGVGALSLPTMLGAAGVNLIDDAIFMMADIANGLDAGDALQGFAKKGLVSAASMFVVGNMTQFGGSVVSKTVLKGVEVMSNNVVSSAINSLDFEAMFKGKDFFNERAFNEGAFGEGAMAGVAAGMAGQFVSGQLGEWNLTDANNSALNGFTFDVKNIQRFNGLMGSMVGAGVTYGMTGNATFNVASLGGTGFMELHLGKDGFGMNFGMSGTDVSFRTINGVVNGFKHLEMNRNIEGAADKNKMDVATALRTQYGFGDQAALKQLDEIIARDTLLAKGNGLPAGARGQTVTENGQRVVYLAGYREGMTREEQLSMGVTLQHEAYRDGVKGPNNEQETIVAAFTHTMMAERMQNDPRYAELMSGVIANDSNLRNDLNSLTQAREQKNLNAFAGYVLDTYDSSADYWKLMKDGSLVNDNDGWLKNEDGKYINKDGSISNTPIPGETIGAAGVETGLLNILNGGTSNRSYEKFSPDKVAAAQNLMIAAGMMPTVNPASPSDRSQWLWDKEGSFIDSVGGNKFVSQMDAGKVNKDRVISTSLLFSTLGNSYDSFIFNTLPAADAYSVLTQNNRNTFGLANFPLEQYSKTQKGNAKDFLKVANRNAEKKNVQAGYPDINGNTDVTWCNRKMFFDNNDTLGSANYSSMLEPLGTEYTRANHLGLNFAENYPELDPAMAQNFANLGLQVRASWTHPQVANVGAQNAPPGHVASVVSSYGIFDPRNGPRISQAGQTNGEMWAVQGFGSVKLPNVKYYWVMPDELLQSYQYVDSWRRN